MHGLVNRSLQCFLRDTYGNDLWGAVARRAGIGPDGFEAMQVYDDALTEAVLGGAAQRLSKPPEALLEDLGAYLVSLEPLRRLLRFGGVGYADFLHSLDDLQGRAQLALPDLGLPALRLVAAPGGQFALHLGSGERETCATARLAPPVLAGMLRAMADDYGALVLIELPEAPGAHGVGTIHIELLEARYATGRRFHLGWPVPEAAP
ncbi:heme NO-binding domain-containing protein [Frigidibacter mobilis]|uniref:Heme NO binding domain-containing protein n=1 Tax=Frigidibacter mobilis TaxID=1335048 RepID=A0A161HBV7_9RHOB|nr:heme NO-binding domain-containing protein [Frigidibacter mobilis]AMY68599.1 heme NO binding domain-containing protein [Frigidibacter mobilis]